MEYLTADQEDDRHDRAGQRADLDDKGNFKGQRVLARFMGEYPMAKPTEVDFMDVSPKQIVSAAASLIPFLEHDDANRALMGCNMQRQAVPLLRADSPGRGHGHGEEGGHRFGRRGRRRGGRRGRRDRDGRHDRRSATMIRTRSPASSFFDQGGVKEYRLRKFKRSNQDTCYNQKPLVMPGREASRRASRSRTAPAPRTASWPWAATCWSPSCPGAATTSRMPSWCPRSLVKEDTYTSLHIEQFELQVRDTKRGVEEVTREIPNVGEEALVNLDEDGIIYPGARVRAGDIMVGKVTPKGETELSPEEKLLRAIFGEKAGDVKDASLKAPPGMDGIVVGVRVFSRQDRTTRSKKEETRQLEALKPPARPRPGQEGQQALAEERLTELFTGQKAHHIIDANTGEVLVKSGRKFTKPDAGRDWTSTSIHWGLPLVEDQKQDTRASVPCSRRPPASCDRIEVEYEKNCERALRGDELAPGRGQAGQGLRRPAAQAERGRQDGRPPRQQGRRLQDHGRGGHALPRADGTPVDVVLNPAGRAQPNEPGPDPRDPTWDTRPRRPTASRS